MNFVCIHHGDCMDGSCAAWCVRRWHHGDDPLCANAHVRFERADYGSAPPDVADTHVIIVDFSYPRDVLCNMILGGGAKSILVLDHHRTAEKSLGDLRRLEREEYDPIAWTRDREGDQPMHLPIRVLFDTSRSGAQLAWDVFHHRAERPRVVDYVADRDLWHNALPDSRAVNAWIASHGCIDDPRHFNIADRDLDTRNYYDLVAEGEAIVRTHDIDVRQAVQRTMRWTTIGEHRVPIANLPRSMTSDGAHLLASRYPNAAFAAAYEDLSSGQRKVSLRTRKGSTFDVSAVAERYGGGGHRGAASFSVPFSTTLLEDKLDAQK